MENIYCTTTVLGGIVRRNQVEDHWAIIKKISYHVEKVLYKVGTAITLKN